MDEPAIVTGPAGDVQEWAAHVSALRGRVRRDRRAASFPLLMLGTAATLVLIPQVIWAGSSSPWAAPLGDWLTGLVITAAFTVTWLVFRRRAVRGGVGRSAGFGAAAVVGACFTLSVGVIAMAFAGPFVIFGLGLLVAGCWQRSRLLIGWALLVGGTGVFEGFFGITNRLPAAVWRQWQHPAIYLALAVATALAGLVTRWQENRA